MSLAAQPSCLDPASVTAHARPSSEARFACPRIAAAILGGVDSIWMKPGSKVLYLGAASGTSVSHVSDLVGEEGTVYAVEFSHRSGRDLINVAKKRANIIPIIEDARHPQKYRMLIGMVDCVFADVAQPDQASPPTANVLPVSARPSCPTVGRPPGERCPGAQLSVRPARRRVLWR